MGRSRLLLSLVLVALLVLAFLRGGLEYALVLLVVALAIGWALSRIDR